MARKPAKTYNVHRAQDGAQIVTGVSLAVARTEVARLNAEACIPIAASDPNHPEPRRPTGMLNGETVCYETRSAEGVVIG